jgi:hypothetical protein
MSIQKEFLYLYLLKGYFWIWSLNSGICSYKKVGSWDSAVGITTGDGLDS